jgi:phosphoesterase RecJ-like protein
LRHPSPLFYRSCYKGVAVLDMSGVRRGSAEDRDGQQQQLAQVLAGGIEDKLAEAGWHLLENATRILLLAHYNPDPDALGSALGLAYVLAPLGKQCVVACADAVPARFSFLPGWEQVVDTLPDERFDLVVALDAGDLSRYGALYDRHKPFFDSATILNIDHHVTSHGCGAVNMIDPRCAATAELLTVFLLNRGVSIGKEAAICLLSGIITDTRSFEYDATTAQTLAAGAYLVGRGAVPQDIVKPMYRMKPFAELHLWGKVLDTAQLSAGGRLIWATLREEFIRQSGATQDMDDGLPSYLLDTDGVAVALLFRERDDGLTRVSIRTMAPYDAAAISAHFGGGGHVRAAGCTMYMNLDEAVRQMVSYAESILAGDTGE